MSDDSSIDSTIVYPSVGPGLDYDPSKRIFNVPVVDKTLLLQKGGNYITEFVPPSIVLQDGRTFVLITENAKKKFRLEDNDGVAVVHATAYDQPLFPPMKLTNATSYQDRVYCLVQLNDIAAKGKISETQNFPSVSIPVKPGSPLLAMKVVSPEFVRTTGIPKVGTFILPRLTEKSPFPLKVVKGMGHQESFAIPPKLKEEEFASGRTELSTGASIGMGIGFFIAVILFLYFLFRLKGAL